ncbi:hypothetical protein [Microbulbifer sp. PSTR4-B]|uniref:hypothetical protein n=1 Tax=Microbulbifer sp. PSTR4-B TaxID=3243396 RepID=UPI004039EB78
MQNLISDVVLGASIGSFITIVGMWLANRYQLKSKKEDREHSLKSGIYLAAAEQLVTSKLMIMKLPNISQQEMESSSAQGVATAKLTIVAENSTVQAVTELSAAIAQAILALVPEKLPLDNLRTDIQILSSQLDGNFQKQNQMLNEMTAYNLRGDSDPRLWKALQDNFDHYSSQIDHIVKSRDAKYTELNRAMKELFVKCMEASISLSELEVKAITCIRNELNMPFNESEYRKTIEANNSKMEAEFSKFLVRVPDAA